MSQNYLVKIKVLLVAHEAIALTLLRRQSSEHLIEDVEVALLGGVRHDS